MSGINRSELSPLLMNPSASSLLYKYVYVRMLQQDCVIRRERAERGKQSSTFATLCCDLSSGDDNNDDDGHSRNSMDE